jgi:hypothetical protein
MQQKNSSTLTPAAGDRSFETMAVLGEDFGVAQATIEAAQQDAVQARLSVTTSEGTTISARAWQTEISGFR